MDFENSIANGILATEIIDNNNKIDPTKNKKQKNIKQINETKTNQDKIEKEESNNVSKIKYEKSVFIAYLCWLIGGPLGLHLIYLRRDRQAFTWATTLGGYFFIGFFGDFFKIPKYVHSSNEDPEFIRYYLNQLRNFRKPQFSLNRFISAITVSYFWSQVAILAIPKDEVFDINWKFLYLFVPLIAALGVWNIGNIGHQKGDLWWCLGAAYICYPLRYYIGDESMWITILTFTSATAFDVFSKQWRREPPKKQRFIKRFFILSTCLTLYLILIASFIYFNGTVTDSEGEEIPVREAISHFFTSAWWLDFKNSLYEIYLFGQQHGWYEIWKQIIEMSDPHGELNAYRVLGVSQDSSQSEITSQWRQLSRKYHPDKVKNEKDRREAQEKFMEIQQAYEILSSIKNKRQRNSKKLRD